MSIAPVRRSDPGAASLGRGADRNRCRRAGSLRAVAQREGDCQRQRHPDPGRAAGTARGHAGQTMGRAGRTGPAPVALGHQREQEAAPEQGRQPPPALALYMPALCATRHDPHVKAYYRHLIEDNGLKKIQAVCAVMRKLLHAIHGMLKHRLPFDGSRFYAWPRRRHERSTTPSQPSAHLGGRWLQDRSCHAREALNLIEKICCCCAAGILSQQRSSVRRSVGKG